jgi:hypothetical protein
MARSIEARNVRENMRGFTWSVQGDSPRQRSGALGNAGTRHQQFYTRGGIGGTGVVAGVI